MKKLQLQIQIVQTKLCVRDAEFAERGELLRRKAENLRKVRARVQEIIADDKEFRNAINGNALWDENVFPNNTLAYEEASTESKFIMELLKELKYDHVVVPGLDSEMLSCGDPSREIVSAENSVYSSADEADCKQDCHVKIVKVTNVYRVAYLRHFIKQKRLRRANRQALLRKKMDSIKKILDDWQKTLSMVINSNLSLVNNSPQVELASQEAMGDCSKPNIYNTSDSDSDFINSTDNFHDNYSLSWTQNQYSPIYAYNSYDEFTGETQNVAREYYDIRDYEISKCQEEQHDFNKGTGVLYLVPEETSSQMEIKEIQSDAE
ncbi:jg23967 [Pararge aegeria aegeria]|uniref:Jg23967 protein n=1 Tax=Pararge aegeria aegeria TaxID=348720 RepID=A0A8S4RE30_9NEOP|nr:jg23967 [Pararge aegeria aegeria]